MLYLLVCWIKFDIVNNVIQTTTTKSQKSTVSENVQNVHP